MDSQVATSDMAGRTCPYCFSPLKEGGTVSACRTCAAVHHSECWRENGGCAVTSCAGGPAEPGEAPHEAPAAPAVALKKAPAQPGRRRLGRIAAIAAATLAVGGGATAVALSSSDAPSSSGGPAPVVDTQTRSDPPPPPPPDGEDTIGTWWGEGTDELTGRTSEIELDVYSTEGVDDGFLSETWTSGTWYGTLGFSHMEGDTAVFDYVDESGGLDSTVYLTPMSDGTLEFLETWNADDGYHEHYAILE